MMTPFLTFGDLVLLALYFGVSILATGIFKAVFHPFGLRLHNKRYSCLPYDADGENALAALIFFLWPVVVPAFFVGFAAHLIVKYGFGFVFISIAKVEERVSEMLKHD